MTKPTVTDAMVEAANNARDSLVAQQGDRQYEPLERHQAMRAAITAAFEASGVLDLMAKADAVLDHADAHCRAFPIATFPNLSPKSKIVDVWDNEAKRWVTMNLRSKSQLDDDYTHWREPTPPPSNPPLPAVFTDLGAALEKIKGAG